MQWFPTAAQHQDLNIILCQHVLTCCEQEEHDGCDSRAYAEGAEQRDAKDLDVVFGEQRLLLILLLLPIPSRVIPSAVVPSAAAALCFTTLCKMQCCE